MLRSVFITSVLMQTDISRASGQLQTVCTMEIPLVTSRMNAVICCAGNRCYCMDISGISADEGQYRNLIIWLEDQKIRHYKIEDRKELRDVSNTDWQKSFKKVRIFLHLRQNTAQYMGLML